MSVYLAEHGGAASDKAYKWAGALVVIGPFDSTEDARAFCRVLDDRLLDDYYQPLAFALLVGRVEAVIDGDGEDPGFGKDGGLVSPSDRLGDELRYRMDCLEQGCRDDFEESEQVQLDRWLPGWDLEPQP